MFRLETNVMTGETKKIPLTPEEIAEINARPATVIPYTEKRRDELVALDGDGMDAMRKAVVDILAALNLPQSAELSAYLDKVRTIKERYPKT